VCLEQCFSTFLLQGNLSQCLCCSWNLMQWSKYLYCCNRKELWLRISSQAISVCFGWTWQPLVEPPKNCFRAGVGN